MDKWRSRRYDTPVSGTHFKGIPRKITQMALMCLPKICIIVDLVHWSNNTLKTLAASLVLSNVSPYPSDSAIPAYNS